MAVVGMKVKLKKIREWVFDDDDGDNDKRSFQCRIRFFFALSDMISD